MSKIKLISLLFVLFCSVFQLKAQDINWYPYRDIEGKWSFVSVEGDRLSKAFFDSLTPFISNVTFVKNNNKWGMINSEGKYLIPLEYDSLFYLSGNDLRFVLAGKKDKINNYQYGLFLSNGSSIIPVKYNKINLLIENRSGYAIKTGIVAEFGNNKGNLGLYSMDGRLLLPHEYSSINTMYGFSEMERNPQFCVFVSKWENNIEVAGGYNLSKEKWVFPCKYLKANLYSDWGQGWINPYTPNKFCPLINDYYIKIPSGNIDQKKTYDYYSLSGKFLFDTKHFSENLNSTSFYYVAGDSIIAESSIQCECQKLDTTKGIYALNVNGLLGLYDINKGFILDTGLYLYYQSGFRLIEGKFMAQKRNSTIHAYIDLEGNETPVKERFYPDGSLILRDETGEEINLSPYKIKQSIKNESSLDVRYIVELDGFYGIINPQKKTLMPLNYNQIIYHSEYHLIECINKNGREYYDENLNRIAVLKGEEIRLPNAPRFIRIIVNKHSYNIYNLKTHQQLLKNKSVPSKEQKDTLKLLDIPYIAFNQLPDYNLTIQILNSDSKWECYNEKGELLYVSQGSGYQPTEPIFNGDFVIGYVYNLNRDEYTKTYTFLNGMKLQGLSTMRSLYHLNDEKKFLVYDNEGIVHIFDSTGNHLVKYDDYIELSKGYVLFKLNYQYLLYDSNYRVVFDKNVELIESFENGCVLKTGVNYLFVSFSDTFNISKNYTKIDVKGRLHFPFLFCYNDQKSFDLINLNGQVLYSNCTYSKVENGYIIIRSGEYECWLTSGLKEYAKHRIR